eukprot:TRINITY_DN15922_c0_g1_i1.p1 TRINITY_DN15922_c0_g1~~TRINITY_DN15922_c0_g1_i1.p1  ORF type:complete len:239 (+),score=57.28 TRINITY_DN15922_c0_g1_i1:86-802(+)
MKELDPVLTLASDGDVEGLRTLLADTEQLPKRLRKKDEDQRTAVHRACAAGHQEVVALLIASGADVNCEDEEGWTPLHSSASRGDDAIVSMLLEAKANADEVTSSGASALHFAASKGHITTAQHLLQAGAKRNIRDKRGGTALLRAAGCGRDKMVSLLLEAKADIKAKDAVGDNAFHVAINSQNVDTCAVLMALDEAHELMTQENSDGVTPAKQLMDMQPLEVRDTIRSVWRDKQVVG